MVHWLICLFLAAEMSWMKREVSDGNTWDLAKWNWRSPTSRMRPFFVSAVWCATPAPTLWLTRNLILAEPGQVRPSQHILQSKKLVWLLQTGCVLHKHLLCHSTCTRTFWQPWYMNRKKDENLYSHVSVKKLTPIYICICLYLKYNLTQVDQLNQKCQNFGI